MEQFNNDFPVQHSNTQKGFSIAALILGILSILSFFTIVPPILFAILAIVFGVLGLKKNGKGIAIAGISTAGAGLIITIIFLIFVLQSAANKPVSNEKNNTKEATAAVTKTFISPDGAVSLNYDTSLWEFQNNIAGTNVTGLAFKDSVKGKFIGGIQCKEFKEKLTEESYIKMLENAYKKDAIEGSITTSKLKTDTKEFSVVHAKKKDGDMIVNIDTLVVYNGINQYEFIFQAADKNYEKCKNYAYDVFKSAKVLKEAEATVINDPELAKAMESLDKTAGIDKKSVLENVGKDGKELVGSWGFVKKDGSIDIRLVLNADGTYKRYKKYPDETSILTGTWSYDGNRLLKVNTTKALEDGKDAMANIKPEQEYEIFYFKDNKMRIRHYPSLDEYEYKRAK